MLLDSAEVALRLALTFSSIFAISLAPSFSIFLANDYSFFFSVRVDSLRRENPEKLEVNTY